MFRSFQSLNKDYDWDGSIDNDVKLSEKIIKRVRVTFTYGLK